MRSTFGVLIGLEKSFPDLGFAWGENKSIELDWRREPWRRNSPVPALPIMKTECRTSKISFSWITFSTKLFCAVGLASSACKWRSIAASRTLLSNSWFLQLETSRASLHMTIDFTSFVRHPEQEIDRQSDSERSACLPPWSSGCWNLAVRASELYPRSSPDRLVAVYQQPPGRIWSHADPSRNVPERRESRVSIDRWELLTCFDKRSRHRL